MTQTIRYAVSQCSLGSVLVAATNRGICAVFLGDDADTLLRDLRNRFHDANLVAATLEQQVAQVVAMIEKPTRDSKLPLDLHGTEFQKRVWESLRRIPLGRTSSYRDIAKRIGRPTASRAVAQACGANPVAVAVPCHRVVRTDHSLSGYRWGIERKAELLRREGASS